MIQEKLINLELLTLEQIRDIHNEIGLSILQLEKMIEVNGYAPADRANLAESKTHIMLYDENNKIIIEPIDFSSIDDVVHIFFPIGSEKADRLRGYIKNLINQNLDNVINECIQEKIDEPWKIAIDKIVEHFIKKHKLK